MEFQEVVKGRREVTSFLDQPISSQILDEILEAAWLAPTGNHLVSREFIVVKDQKMLEHLSATTPFMPWLKEAGVGIVITGNPTVSKYWIQDASIAGGFLWLAAVNAGLGCAFGAVYNTTDEKESMERESYVREALKIPDDRRIIAVLGMGYENIKPKAKTLHKKSDVIHNETFSSCK